MPLVLVAAAAGSGYFLYQKFFATPEVFAVYERFADALAQNRFDEARAMADGEEAMRQIAEKEGVYRFAVKMQMKADILGTSSVLQSQKTSGDTAELTMIHDVRLNPPGQFSAIGTTVRHRHVARLRKVGGAWKVTSFNDEVQK